MKTNNRERVIIRTSIIGILGNILLVGFKAAVGFIAGSVSIILDALNNFTDALSSIITIIGTKLSNKKPDRKHPFGHGRIEYITATLIAALILFAGGLAIYESIMSIIDYFQNKTMPDYSIVSLIIIGVAVLVKTGIGIFYKIQGKKVDSDVLKASGTDALWDAVLSTATLVGAIFAYALGWYVEGYLGILIGLFILKAGIGVLRDAISSIIGERYDAEETRQIIEDINAIPGVNGAYDLILNSYGHKRNIGSVHIGVSGKLTAIEVQTIERQITAMMYQKHNTIMTVGIYADNVDSEESQKIRAYLASLLKPHPTILQLHGFFVDVAEKICNFDLVISFDEKEPEKLITQIKSELEKQFPDFYFYINLDRDYSLS